MGRPKMLLPVRSGTLLSASVQPLLEAELDLVVVVLGCDADAVARGAGVPHDARVRIVVNPSWADGMSSSLRCGLRACAAAEAVLAVLGDQPPSVGLVRRIRGAWRGQPLVVPVVGSRARHPVLFGRSIWPELDALRGDIGGRDVVRRHWDDAATVPGEAVWDVDRDEDYRALLAGKTPCADDGLEVL
jgi:CTP:molybdopterin cytidylyltransferase MocA